MNTTRNNLLLSGLLLGAALALFAAAPAQAQMCFWTTHCYVHPNHSWCCDGCWVCI